MVKQYAIVRYDQNRKDEYFDPTSEEWVSVIPNRCFYDRETAEDRMSSLEKDSDFDYSVERVH